MTKDELEIWLEDPTTKLYFNTVNQIMSDLEDNFESFGFMEETNELVLRNIFRHEGKRQIAEIYRDPVNVLKNFIKEESA